MGNNKMPLCIVDYYSKFLFMKEVNSLALDGLKQTAKMIFAEYGLLHSATMLLNRPIRGLLPQLIREPINVNP